MSQSRPTDSGRDTAPAAQNQIANMARGSGLNLAAAFVSQASLFGISIVLARVLGATEVGQYGLAFAVRALLMLVCLVGMRGALTRYVAVYRVDGDHGAVRGTIIFGIGTSVTFTLAVGAVLFMAAPWLADSFFDDPALSEYLRITAISLPTGVLTVGALSATQGFRTMRYHALIGLVFEPIARFALTIGLLAAGLEVRGAMIALALASGFTAVLAVGALLGLLAETHGSALRWPIREVFRFARVSWLSSLASQGLLWADIIILGALVESAEVGVYQVATRLLLVTTLAEQAMNSSFAPRAADLWRRGNGRLLRRTYTASTNWILLLSVPAIVVLVGFPRELLRLFGDEFTPGVSVIYLLAIGQLVKLATSPGGIVLNMSGRNGLNMFDNIVALILNVGLNLVFIPVIGIDGAAIAWTIALTVSGTFRVVQVRNVVLGRRPYDQVTGHIALSGMAMLAAVGLASVITSGFIGLVVGAAVGGLVYVLALVYLGLSENEAALISVLRARAQGAVS